MFLCFLVFSLFVTMPRSLLAQPRPPEAPPEISNQELLRVGRYNRAIEAELRDAIREFEATKYIYSTEQEKQAALFLTQEKIRLAEAARRRAFAELQINPEAPPDPLVDWLDKAQEEMTLIRAGPIVGYDQKAEVLRRCATRLRNARNDAYRLLLRRAFRIKLKRCMDILTRPGL